MAGQPLLVALVVPAAAVVAVAVALSPLLRAVTVVPVVPAA